MKLSMGSGVWCGAAAVLALCARSAAQEEWDDPAELPRQAGGDQAAPAADAAWVFVLDWNLDVWSGSLELVEDGSVEVRSGEGRLIRFGPGEWAAVYAVSATGDPALGPGGVTRDGVADGPTAHRLVRRVSASGAEGDEGAGRGMLITTDGRWLPGRAVDGSEGAVDVVRWEHIRGVTVDVRLDDVECVCLPGGPSPVAVHAMGPGERDDLLILANDDRLAGFVESIGSSIQFDGPDGVVDVPGGLAGAVLLANEREPRSGGFIWFDDGTVVDASSVVVRDDAVFVESGTLGAFRVAGARSVTAIVADAGRLVGLGECEAVSQASVGDRRRTGGIERIAHPGDLALPSGWSMGVADVLLPGPMEVTWEFPEGAERVAASAVLAEPAGPWADCVVHVAVDGREVMAERLSSARPAALLDVALRSGSTMVVRLDAGEHGAVQDSVVLRRPVVVIGEGAGR